MDIAPAAGPPGRSPAELVETLAEAVLVLGEGLRVHYLNAAAEDLLGTSRRRAVGAPLDALVTLAPDWRAHVAEALAGGEAFTAREIALTPANASEGLYVDATVTPLEAPARDPEVLVEINPIERHRRIAREEALRAQEQANRSLLRGLAHEIRNPLAGLRGAAQLLEAELTGPGLAEYTRVIVREADRLRDLVERMVGPAEAPQKTPVNVHQATEHVVRLLRAEAPAGVEVATDYDPSLPELRADRDQLVQALLNLGRNALQAVTGAGGRIELRTSARRRITLGQTQHRLVACIEVADDGPGVPDELLETLFQPMVSGRADGSGLGLTIAQSLVGRHGGLVECDSVPGATVFRVLLPLEGADG